MAARREIKIHLNEDSEPYLIKFSTEVDLDDMQLVLLEAIENIAVKNHANYDAWDSRNSHLFDLKKVSGGETIVLYEKGKSPNKSFVAEEDIKQGYDRNNSNNQTPVKVNAPAERDKSLGRPGIVSSISRRILKPETGSVMNAKIFSKPNSRSPSYGGYTGDNNSPHVHSKVAQSELNALYDRCIRIKRTESASKHAKIDLEEENNTKAKLYKIEEEHKSGISIIQSNLQSKWNTGSIATTSQDGKDENIYSFRRGHPPFTFSLAGFGFDEKKPPPKYLPYNEIKILKPLDLESIFKGQDITKDGELKITDKVALKNQEGIVGDFLKRLAKSVAEGRGTVGVSLPIRIFEPRSLVERVTDWWSFAPVYLTPAALKTDPLERMKHVVAFAMSGLYVSVSPFKPFNPILGETYQGEFPGYGITISVEHTSHHPPIANFYVVHKDWKFYGRYEFKGDISTFKNCLTINQEGPNVVEFADGHKIVFYLPTIRVGGMIAGDKTTRYKGIVKFVDEANKIKCVVRFDPSDRKPIYDKKRKDVYGGLIYRYLPGVAKKEEDDEKMKDLKERIEEVHGQWLEKLYIGDTKWWDIKEQKPVRAIPIENPLASDWRFREDLIWVKRGDRKFGEAWKLFLEVRQREEKKLREAGKKKLKK